MADAELLGSVAGPRVRFLCIDASPTHVLLGASTSSLYLFARSPPASGSGAEAPLRFVGLITPELPTHSKSAQGRGPSSAIAVVRFHSPSWTRCAVGTAAGEVLVVGLGLEIGRAHV